jgi:transmembrane sensor
VTKQELTELFIKMLNNQCSEEEAELIVQLLSADENAEVFNELIEKQLRVNVDEGIDADVKEHLNENIEFILRNAQSDEKILLKPKWSNKLILLSIAALILVFFGIGLYSYNREAVNNTITAFKKKQKVIPGSNQATLTLADGTLINLNKSSVGKIAQQASRVVNKVDDGKLLYQRHIKDPIRQDTVLYNVLTTPRGGQYQVELPDGTKVWLNAASSIKYPTTFSKNERKVELTGEAYFEVAKMQARYESNQLGTYVKRLPFIVVCNKQEIEVLGTRFNINAYADEPHIKTSLIQGSIRIHWAGKFTADQPMKFDKVLEAGEQAVLDDGKLAVSTANVNSAIDWKNGKFQFENEPVESIMRKIARWYNVDIEYRGDMSMKVFSGTLSRYDDVMDVLKMLELTGTINFKLKNRKIIVFG